MLNNQGTVQKNQEAFLDAHKNFSEQWKATKLSYIHGDDYYQKLAAGISAVSNAFDELDTYYQKESEKLIKNQSELSEAVKRDSKFSEGAEDFLKSRTDELAKRIKHMDALQSKMKELLTNMNGKKLAALKVNKNPVLLQFFTTLFRAFYKEQTAPFEWEKFSQLAFVKDKCEDFVYKLVSSDFATLSDEQVNELLKLKNDEGLLKIGKEATNADNILDLINYLEYLPDAVKTQQDITDLKKEIEKIKHDVPHRKVKADLDSQRLKASDEMVKYIEDLHKRFSKSIETFGDEIKKVNDMCAQFDKQAHHVLESGRAKVNSISAVPKNIYQ